MTLPPGAASSAPVRANEPLAPYTTIELGGPARYLWDCDSEAGVHDALAFAEEHGLPLQVLGGGSNIIFPDAGFPGVVLRISIGGMTLTDRGSQVQVDAGAGVEWDALVRHAVSEGLSGVECLSGIPGSVGGTPIQNVGAYGQEVAETLASVRCIDRGRGTAVEFRADQCGFGYRSSRFKSADRDRFVVVGVTFQLQRQARPALRYPELARAVAERGQLDAMPPADAVRRVRDTVLALRRAKSMVIAPGDPNRRSVGSFFLNPVLSPHDFQQLTTRWHPPNGTATIPTFPAPGGVKVPAAWLVEQAGYRKGYVRDAVGISTRHALALINRGGGTARELLALAEEIEAAVWERFGVRLTREPVVVSTSVP